MKILKRHKTFSGWTCFAEHESKQTKTKMGFSFFYPYDIIGEIDSCLLWLSGLTCTQENFITKAGAQFHLAGKSMMIVCPDTSPRGLQLVHEHDDYDFGSGASFYVDAVTPGYEDHYRMESYIVLELIDLLRNEFGIKKFGISGHSMGGHGALVLGLKHSSIFKSISAFSPITNPSNCPWGVKAFRGYFGENCELWLSHDATELVKSGLRADSEILIDQGLADEFYESQLKTPIFEKACHEASQKLQVRYHEGFDHSYYFVQSFIADHCVFHLNRLVTCD